MSDVMKDLLEVGKRNIRNAIWRFEDLSRNLVQSFPFCFIVDMISNLKVEPGKLVGGIEGGR